VNRLEQMRVRLNALEPISLDIVDESHRHAGHAGARSGAGHYAINIVSAQFVGRNTVARHRMIYSALGAMMQGEIHALTINAITPDGT
jgi:BolA protein